MLLVGKPHVALPSLCPEKSPLAAMANCWHLPQHPAAGSTGRAGSFPLYHQRLLEVSLSTAVFPELSKLLIQSAGSPPVSRFSCFEPTPPASPVRMCSADHTDREN